MWHVEMAPDWLADRWHMACEVQGWLLIVKLISRARGDNWQRRKTISYSSFWRVNGNIWTVIHICQLFFAMQTLFKLGHKLLCWWLVIGKGSVCVECSSSRYKLHLNQIMTQGRDRVSMHLLAHGGGNLHGWPQIAKKGNYPILLTLDGMKQSHQFLDDQSWQ